MKGSNVLKLAHPHRLLVRRRLIKESVDRSNEKALEGSTIANRWNYTISADADIELSRCPLCFRAYSDYEVSAVAPCYRCREEQSLADVPHGLAPVDERRSVTLDCNDPRLERLERYIELVIYKDLQDDVNTHKRRIKGLTRQIYLLKAITHVAFNVLEINIHRIYMDTALSDKQIDFDVSWLRRVFKADYLDQMKPLKVDKEFVLGLLEGLEAQLVQRGDDIRYWALIDKYRDVA